MADVFLEMELPLSARHVLECHSDPNTDHPEYRAKWDQIEERIKNSRYFFNLNVLRNSVVKKKRNRPTEMDIQNLEEIETRAKIVSENSLDFREIYENLRAVAEIYKYQKQFSNALTYYESAVSIVDKAIDFQVPKNEIDEYLFDGLQNLAICYKRLR
jgi:tetratricopeptide (TPR) repeat protein